MLFLTSLDENHVLILRSIPLLRSLQILLPLVPLLVKVGLERNLYLLLLKYLITFDSLLNLVLVAEDSTPLIKDLFLLLDWEMSACRFAHL